MIRILLLCLCLVFSKEITSANGLAEVIFSNYELDDTLFMNREAVRRIFTKKDIRWPNGTKIIVYIKPIESIEHRTFVYSVLKMTMYRFLRDVESETTVGRTEPIGIVRNDIEMETRVKKRNGSVGYINYNVISNNKKIILYKD